MKWESFLERFADCPLIEPAMVYVGQGNPRALQAQLSRWVRGERLIKLARGKYILARPYRKVDPPLEYVANRLVYPSYVSLERALAWYGFIPEAVEVVTSVTTGRPRVVETALGTFRYRHIHRRHFWGYEALDQQGQACLLAVPEKAILDLFYFQRGATTPERIQEMRLQNLDRLDPNRLRAFVDRMGGRKLAECLNQLFACQEEFLQGYDST